MFLFVIAPRVLTSHRNSDQGHALPLDPKDWAAWIISKRPPRETVDPFKPHGFFLEEEPSANGRVIHSGCILLTNKECPWRCLMCDLWKHTLSSATPIGAIPRQIRYAIEQLGCKPEQVKLYNSGSFFDAAAIPVLDYEPIARELSFARHVIVECHPRLIGEKVLRFKNLISGSLEVAMGLETVHPEVLPRLNKRFDLEDFRMAADFLRENGIALRVFILVKPPYVTEHEAVSWAIKSAEFAFRCGATVVSLIPTRPGNGALEALVTTGDFSAPSLRILELAFEGALSLKQGRAFADTWDLDRFSNCAACFPARKRRLDTMNLTQMLLSAVNCGVCGC